ncbi:hypothetical protein BVZ23_22770 [Klebsiella variicola]|uniref:putative quinol monooxygenase n=1 Tax=Klebsiella variicola TaxID=244366 RepID=UPI000A2EBE56|nr:putative quinol monooxygenase [Klebsiella variicola]OSZ08403.1 hypothetical protein BVZ23_22770 [Klebsiella variicola]
MIHVIAIITAKPGLRSEVVSLIENNMRAVRSEKGCIEYTPLIDLSLDAGSGFGRDTVVIVEKWEDEVCLKNHAESSHMKRYAENAKFFIQKREVCILKNI